jgi:hypothetical protein
VPYLAGAFSWHAVAEGAEDFFRGLGGEKVEVALGGGILRAVAGEDGGVVERDAGVGGGRDFMPAADTG